MLAQSPAQHGVTVGFSTKSYFGHQQTLSWISAVREAPVRPDIQQFVAVSFPAITQALTLAQGQLLVGAQNCSAFDSGPHTGEVSAELLAEIGTDFVELGHAEHRASGDTDAIIAQKVSQAHSNGLDVLLCVGEAVRGDASEAATMCLDQIDSSRVDPNRTMIAYEPVWAIGGASPAPTDHIVETVSILRERLGANGPRVIYGGTAGPGLLQEIYPTVTGLFLGRRAHEPQAYLGVISEVEALLNRRSH